MKWKIMSNQEDGPLFYDDFENYNSNNEREDGVNPDEDDEEEDDDDDVLASNDQMLGDWRSFRRKLAADERKSSPSSNSVQEPPNHPSNSSTVSSGTNGDAATTPEPTTQRTVTTKNSRNPKMKSPNEILLAQQNEKLALEYHNDVWAHEIATVRAFNVTTLHVVPSV
jgi:hypothetical protein